VSRETYAPSPCRRVPKSWSRTVDTWQRDRSLWPMNQNFRSLRSRPAHKDHISALISFSHSLFVPRFQIDRDHINAHLLQLEGLWFRSVPGQAAHAVRSVGRLQVVQNTSTLVASHSADRDERSGSSTGDRHGIALPLSI
jgi:hypothetical protein